MAVWLVAKLGAEVIRLQECGFCLILRRASESCGVVLKCVFYVFCNFEKSLQEEMEPVFPPAKNSAL